MTSKLRNSITLQIGVAVLLGLTATTRAAEKPNIVLILADDLGYGDVGCFNPKSRVSTPHLDKLAKQGIRFTDAHSPATVCTPSRYSLLTATCAGIVGAKLPKNAAEDSVSILPALLSREREKPLRAYTLHQTMNLSLGIRRGPWKLLDHKGSGGNNYNTPRMKPYAIKNTAPDAPGQLYNLRTDPGERRNVYSERPQIVRELKKLLEQSKTGKRSAGLSKRKPGRR